MPKTEVIYVTFARDLDWLRFSLESFVKFGKGFSGVKIVVPTWDVNKFLQFERYSTPECPVLIKNFMEYPSKGFVHHLAMKCYGDVFCPDADFVLHMDPDCLFTAPFTPEDYIVGSSPTSDIINLEKEEYMWYRPILVIEPYEVLKTVHPARYNWKQVTEAAVKFDVSHETMCRHPAVHPRKTYKLTRDVIESAHGTPFIDFVIKQKNSYPQGFGEFNTLGAVAMEHLPESYIFVDRENIGIAADPPSKLWQGWSYTGVHSKENAAKIKEILG